MNHFDFTGCRIAVVGDLMLDKYLSGSVERLSPEAPVPVLVRETESCFGWGG
jgi:D-beta-D-heptose 7-phosphate kinase/D-beta-D-heptose 1-phosphate adenosyltransferase